MLVLDVEVMPLMIIKCHGLLLTLIPKLAFLN